MKTGSPAGGSPLAGAAGRPPPRQIAAAVRTSSPVRRALFVMAGLLITAGNAGSGRANVTASTDAKPKLVVLIAIDQMRADYIQRFGGAWHKGWRRLLREGAVFTAARYPYLNTITCAGHFTIGTGAYPHRHGMVLNGWWDRSRKQIVECTDDANSPLISYGGEGRFSSAGNSAQNLLVPTLADVMKASLTPRPRIVSFAGKARSAIGLVGSGGDVVTWMDNPGWVTARKFTNAPDPLVVAVIARHPVATLVAKPWTKVGPASAYQFADDDATEAVPVPFWTNQFPHVLAVPDQYLGAGAARSRLSPLVAWDRSPMTDEFLLALATSAIATGKLGQGAGTDLLALSFSALDSVGHAFGPRSHEIQDVLLRLDVVLGDLLAHLDRHVGRGRYLLALTADHGVATFPEQLRAEGKDAGRIALGPIVQAINKAIVGELGPGRFVENVVYTEIYLAPGVAARLRAKPGANARVAAAIAAEPGVLAAFSADQLKDDRAAADVVQRAAALSHLPERSGDFAFAPKPNWIIAGAGTTHGTSNDYDQRVPLILFGAGIKRGSFTASSSPADVAPTLAAVLGVALPTAEGRVLTEAVPSLRRAAAAPVNARP